MILRDKDYFVHIGFLHGMLGNIYLLYYVQNSFKSFLASLLFISPTQSTEAISHEETTSISIFTLEFNSIQITDTLKTPFFFAEANLIPTSIQNIQISTLPPQA